MLAGTSLANLVAPPLIHGWREHSTSPLPKLDDSLVAQLRAQTEGYRWLDRQHGSAELLRAAARHARNLADLWRRTDDRHGLRDQVGDWFRCSAELAA